MSFPARSCLSVTAVAELLRPDDAAGFPAQDTNGHCLQNRSDREAQLLDVGARVPGDTAYYSDIDMVAPANGKPAIYTHRDGTPYADIRRAAPDSAVRAVGFARREFVRP
jgi:uncharacterized cupin superfamily protein